MTLQQSSHLIKDIGKGRTGVPHQDVLTTTIPTAAYIHIPFCRRRCYYCDFPISVVGDNTTSNNAATMVEEYLWALKKEIQTAPQLAKPLQTVFFGGGTPSILSVWQLAAILNVIDRQLGIAADAEISIEMDPGTFDLEKLQGYLDAGINRISLGVQSFDDQLLAVCGRTHNHKDILQAIALIKQADVPNFSLDLISGLPHQTLQQCQDSCLQAIDVAPHHLSCYDLVLEPVTAFGKQYQPGKTPLPSDDDAAAMYRLTQQLLTKAGYQHYEISNYAQLGYQCRHNQVYWHNQPYYGFGMGAASYVAGKRFSRPRTRREYYAWLDAGAIIDAPVISSTDYLLETLMLGLRLQKGVDLAQFTPDIVDKIWSCLQTYYEQGLVELVGDDGRLIKLQARESLSNLNLKLRLNDPEGFLFSNTILAALFEQFD